MFACFSFSIFNFQLPKYVNTSAASGYRKGETLYGMHKAKEAVTASGEVYLVEGYKDALAMHAAGFTNTVALGGTAFTEGHRQLLHTYGTEKVYIVMDADKAGQEAAQKIREQFPVPRAACCVLLPEGDDPDSLFRRLGREAFASYIQRASHPPHETEKRLIDACLQYPDAICQIDDTPYPAADVVVNTTETDGIPLSDPTLLRLSEAGNSQLSTLNSQLEQGSLILHFLYLYYEARLEDQIEAVFKTLKKETDKDTRHTLFARLNDRIELYTLISEKLGRPGVT